MESVLSSMRDPAARRVFAFPLVFYPALPAVLFTAALYGQLSVNDGIAGAIFWGLFVTAVFLVPFAPIAIALRAGWVGLVGYTFAFSVAIGSFAAIPWGVDRLIADDPGSTAALAHLYDPVLETFAVIAALGIPVLARRVRRS